MWYDSLTRPFQHPNLIGNRNCEIEGFHLTKRQNYSCGDYLSQVPCSGIKWKLDPDVFQQVFKASFMPGVDLFALHYIT